MSSKTRYIILKFNYNIFPELSISQIENYLNILLIKYILFKYII